MMEEQKQTEAYHKSRLGQILIKKGYISQQQLNEAVYSSENSSEGKATLLGEYLIEHRIIARWQLRRALSRQAKLRLSVSLTLALLSPTHNLITGSNNERLNSPLPNLMKPLLTTQPISPDLMFEYDPDQSSVEIKNSGYLRLRIPSSWGELNFDRLRLKASGSTNYQTLKLDDIDLSDAWLYIRAIHQGVKPALPES